MKSFYIAQNCQVESLKTTKIQPRTKIIATIGPSTWDDAVLRKMIDSGMTVARINASFADFTELERVSKQIHKLSDKVAIMLDTQGHKIRINKLEKPLWLKSGAKLSIGIRSGIGDIWVSYPDFLKDVKPGAKVLLDDGNLELQIDEISTDKAICKVIVGGELKPLKTVNLPDTHLSFPILTEKDEEDIAFAVENNFDYIAASFIRDINDVAAIKEHTMGSGIKIIAKIENEEGIENFDSILNEVDGIMIARGDLGVELEAQKVPVLQKELIHKCREAGKPVIVATQMLESMRESPKPTRAEVSDVANAVLDGADAVMLSAETSTGKYPSEAVDWMAKICIETEKSQKFHDLLGKTSASPETDAVARTVVDLCRQLPIKKIAVGSKSGMTVISVARHRPGIDIVAFTNSEQLVRQLNLVNGVRPVLVNGETPADRDWVVKALLEKGLSGGYFKKEDMVVLLTGSGIAGKSRNSIVEVAKVFDICPM